MTVKVRKT